MTGEYDFNRIIRNNDEILFNETNNIYLKQAALIITHLAKMI